MNTTRSGEAVPRTGDYMVDEAQARAINAEPWEPPPGMVKQRCPGCRYLFAVHPGGEQRRCPDCVAEGSATA